MLGPLSFVDVAAVERDCKRQWWNFLLAQAGRLPIEWDGLGQRVLHAVWYWYRRRDWEFRELSG
jgi:hypothetical protein